MGSNYQADGKVVDMTACQKRGREWGRRRRTQREAICHTNNATAQSGRAVLETQAASLNADTQITMPHPRPTGGHVGQGLVGFCPKRNEKDLKSCKPGNGMIILGP